jgi:hypothetical protein
MFNIFTTSLILLILADICILLSGEFTNELYFLSIIIFGICISDIIVKYFDIDPNDFIDWRI